MGKFKGNKSVYDKLIELEQNGWEILDYKVQKNGMYVFIRGYEMGVREYKVYSIISVKKAGSDERLFENMLGIKSNTSGLAGFKPRWSAIMLANEILKRYKVYNDERDKKIAEELKYNAKYFKIIQDKVSNDVKMKEYETYPEKWGRDELFKFIGV